MHIAGISNLGKYVVLYPSHRKYSILFVFDSEQESKLYYDKSLKDYGSKKMYFTRIKIALCSHKNDYRIDVGSERCHYIHCPDCNRAIYVDDETAEQKEARRKEASRTFDGFRIESLKEQITELQQNLKQLKLEYKQDYGHDFVSEEEELVIPITITSKVEGITGGTILQREDLEKVSITHDKTDGADLVEVCVNDEVVFKYDANLKGDYVTKNNIQIPIDKF